MLHKQLKCFLGFLTMKKLAVCFLMIPFLLLLALSFIGFYTSPDETVYLSIAKSIPEKYYGFIGSGAVYGNRNRAPALTFFLAPFVHSGFDKLGIVLLSILSILLVYFAGKRYFSQEFGILAAIFLASNHLWLFFSLRTLPEVPFGLFAIASLLLFWEAQKDKRMFPAVGFFLGLAFLTRYSAAILPFIFLGWLAIQGRKSIVSTFKSKWLYIGLAVFLAVLSPWIAYNLVAQGNVAAGASAHLAGSGKSIPWDLTLKSLLVFGAALPFAVVAIRRLVKEKHKLIVYLIFVAFFFTFAQDVFCSSLRYATFLAPIFAFVIAYGVENLKRRWEYVFVAACLINLVVGGAYIASYAFPSQEKNLVSDIINPKSFFGEHKEYTEAAHVIKELSNPDEKILVVYDGGHYVYYYGEREWDAYPQDVGNYELAYVTVLKEDKFIPVPEELKDWRTVYDGKFVKVLENERAVG